MLSESIFSALAKYNSARDENYLTESFAFILNSLLRIEKPIAVAILNQLCGNNEFCFDLDEDISISTQETTEQGRPDIKISSPNKLIYVEVKHDSGLGHQQIERYKKALVSSEVPIRRVVLLTRFAIDFDDQQERPDKHVRWFEVYNWLANVNVKNHVSMYLIKSFISFLEEKQMSIQKIGWEYINGVPALNNLLNMLEVAIKSNSINTYKRSHGWTEKESYQGFYLGGKELWCGVDMMDPMHLEFVVYNKKNLAVENLKTPSYPIKEDSSSILFLLDLNKIHFFSLDKDEQLNEITKFIKKSFDDAQEMKPTGSKRASARK